MYVFIIFMHKLIGISLELYIIDRIIIYLFTLNCLQSIKMHVFLVAFLMSGVLYAVMEQQQLILYFLFTIAVYLGLSAFFVGGKAMSNRKKIMVSTWGNPSEGNIHAKITVRAEKVLALIDQYKDQKKLTLTHFAIKGCGEILKNAQDVSGKLVFGKFVPFKTIDISCLVDIEGGKDLAMIAVQEVDKLSVIEIADLIRSKGLKIKAGKGDADHKRRTKTADYFPVFIVSFLLEIASFFTNKLGLNMPAFGLKRHQFGAGCVTSLGSLKFEDAYAPFSPFMDLAFMLAVNAVVEKPIVENGEVKVGKVINCNFTVDHRYMDGAQARKFVQAFQQVFDEPEKYVGQMGQQMTDQDKKQQ